MKRILLLLIILLSSIAAFAQADLQVSVSDNKVYYRPGQENIYTLSIVNNGPAAASNVAVICNIPAGVEEFSWTGPDDNDLDTDPEDGSAEIAAVIPTIPAGGMVAYIITAKVSGGFLGNLLLQASANATTPDPNTSNNTATDTDMKMSGADISIVNTNNQQFYIPGSTVVYTITVTNNGPLPAKEVQVSNAIPTGITTFSWTGSNGSSGTSVGLNNTVAEMAVGATTTYTITLDIPPTYVGNLTSITNYTSDTADPTPACPQCTDVDILETGADLVITNTNGQASYTPGGSAVYTVTVTNNGPEAAQNVHVTNLIPEGITQFSWTGSNGSSGINVPLDDSIPALADGASVTYTINIQIPASFYGNLSNRVAVTSTTMDPVPGCTQCVDTDTPSAASFANVSVTNTDNQVYYFPGRTSTYTVTVSNAGPATARNIQVVNPIPAGITQFSWTGSNGSSGTDVPLNTMIESLASGASVTYTIIIMVPLTYTGTLQNSASAFSSTNDPNIINNQATDTNAMVVGADLEIVNTNNQQYYVPGTSASYTITITNHGPNSATGISVFNDIPAGVTNFAWSGSNGSNGTGVPLSNGIATIFINTSVTYTVTFDIPPGFLGPLTSAVVVGSSTSDPFPSCPRCSDTDIQQAADIVVTNTDGQDAYVPGTTVVYTVTVLNNGPMSANNVAVSNAIPSGITQFSWTGSNGSTGTNIPLSNIIPVLASGDSVIYTVTIQVPLSYTGTLDSQATATSATAEADPASNSATDSDILATGADIIVVNTDNQQYYNIGSSIVYTMTVTNNGPDAATGVQIQYAAPVGSGSMSWTATNATNGVGSINTSIPTIPAGQTITYTITVQMPPTYAGDLTTNAIVTATSPDPNPGCARCTDIDKPNVAEVSISTTDFDAFYAPGSTIVYTTTVKNNGPLPAANVQVSGLIPAGISNYSWSGNSNSNTTALSDNITNLPAGESVIYTITIQVPAGFTGDLVHSTSVSSTTADSVSANNQSVDTDTSQTGANLVVTNNDNATNYIAGQFRTYTIRVTNYGPQVATNVNVTSLVPAGITASMISWTGTGGPGTGPLAASIPSLAVGETAVYTVTVQIPSSFSQQSNLVHEVVVTSDTADPSPTCTQCVDVDTPNPFADIITMKTNNQTQFLLSRPPTPDIPEGEPEYTTYAIVITNAGPSDAFNVQVQDQVPPGIDAATMKWSSSTGKSGTGSFTDVIPSLAVGEVVTYTVTIKISVDMASLDLVNTVIVDAQTPDNNPACPLCTDTDTPRGKNVTTNATKYTIEQLVKEILIDSPCVQVDQFTHSPQGTYGYYHRNNSSFPAKEGVVIRGGQISACDGPYDGDAMSTEGTGMGGWDSELQQVSNNMGNTGTMRDVSFIKFRFTPSTDDFSFNFIFAANEYGFYQCNWADVFAFILKDETAGTPFQNLAVVPNTNTPIQVTEIRDSAYNSGCSSENPQYFGEYYVDDPAGTAPLNMRGRTKMLTAKAVVIPGHQYTIKLVIADYNDTLFDSAVFIEAGSFNVGNPELKGFVDNGSGTVLTTTEESVCDGAPVEFRAGDEPLDNVTYSWTYEGVLIPGADEYTYYAQEAGTYSVTMQYGDGNCSKTSSMKLTYAQATGVNVLDAENLHICDDPANGPFTWDINQTAYILNGLSPAIYKVKYYYSSDNAKYDIARITNLNISAASGTEIFVRIDNEQDEGACTIFDSFMLIANISAGTISYSHPAYCYDPVVTETQVIKSADFIEGGVFSATPPGLAIDPETGEININVSTAGTYSVIYTIPADACDEYVSPAVTVSISSCLTTTINDRPAVCANSTFDLSTSDAGAGATYQWSDANGPIGTTSVPNIDLITAPATGGTYPYIVTATIGSETSAPSQLMLVVHPVPVATVSAPAMVCTGALTPITFTGTADAIVMYDDGSGPQPLTIEPDGSTTLNAAISAPTTYTIISVKGNTVPDCMQTIAAGTAGSTTTIDVGLPDASIVSTIPATLCSGSASTITIQGTPGTTEVRVSVAGVATDVPVTLDASGVGTYTTAALNASTVFTLVDARNADCIQNVGDTSNITVNPMPSLTAFTASPNPVCSGSDVTLSFTGTQGATLSFSSSADGGTTLVPVLIDATGTGTALISNVTASVTFSIADLTSSDNCQVTTGFPADVTVTISELPLITDEPDNQGLCPGATEVEFTVAANGTNVEYSWYGPAGLISGADQPTLTINNPTVADVGDYYVIASNSCASDTSAIATLSISQPIVITSASAGETVCEGSSRDLEVTVTGDASMTYQWYVNGTTQVNNDSALMISGATTPTLTLGNITPAQAGSYTLVINNTCGQPVTSPPIVYIVDTKPAITVSPVPDNECSGGTVRLNVVATGTNVTYEWFKSPSTTALVNGGRISGADTDNLEIYPADPSDAGLYYVVVSGDCAPPVQSTPVQVDVPLAPSIAAQPVSQQKCAGENLTLSAGAPVDPSFTYQWFVNGTTALTDGSGITGAMTAQLEINPVSASHAGNYTVVVTSGSCPTFTSDIAIITVNEPPVITLQPVDVNQCEGTDFTISVVATGTAVEYQWYRGTTALVDNVDGVTGAQTAMLEISPSDDIIHTGLYHVVVTGTGACSGISVTSANAQVIIREAPSLAAAAADQAICEGESFTLTATPTPGTSFTYQWQFEGNDLSDIPGEVSGSETPVLTVTGATPGREGLYTLAVGNGTCDDFESIPTTVIVNEAPVVVDTPDSQVVCVGNTFSLSTVVTGDVATYKWYFNGEPMTDDLDGRISGSDTSSLTIMNTTPADQGSYYAVIASACPDRTSGVAMITMVDLPVATIGYNGPDLCEDSANEVIFTGTGGAIVTYTVNGGDERTITLNPGGTAILLTGLLDETTVYQLLQVELNNCPVDLTTAPGSTATVTVNRLPDIRLDQDGYICTDAVTGVVMQTYTLDTELDAADYTFQWSFEGVQIPGATLPSYAAGQVGRYSVAVTSLSAGCTQSATADITSSSPPISVSATSLSTYFDEDATIVVTVNPPGEYEYRLDEGPYQSSNTFRNVSTLSTTSQSGTHTVWARDLKACGEAPFMITLIDYPKYFTPNGDGYHDTWNISTLSNQPNAKIYIFDRFGKLLKQISTTGAGWDGTYNGAPLTADDYWFTISYTENGMPREFKAHFTLKR